MNILVHSASTDSMGLCLRLKEEGHKVTVFIKDKSFKRCGDGLIDKVDTFEQGLSKNPTFVLFDLSGDGKLADVTRKRGFKVIGGSEMADKLEEDRQFGLDVAKKYGIKVPKGSEFKSVSEAINFVKKSPKGYAVKISGGDAGCASSYVSKDASDMVDYLQYQKEQGKIKDGMDFILQEKVDGVEISTEVWFSDGVPLLPYNSTFENKKFMPGDLGPATGCETSLVFPYLSSSPKIIEKTLGRMFSLFQSLKWTGPMDINCIVSEKDYEPYFLEFTPRLGYSAIYALAAMIETGLGDFLYDVASGNANRVPIRHSWGTSLKISVPPYPLEPENPLIWRELYGEIEGARIKLKPNKGFWPIDVKKGHGKDMEASGVNGIIGECTGAGNTIDSAWNQSKKVFEEVDVPNKMGRILDGIDSARKRVSKLRSFGYDVPKSETKEVAHVR